MGKVEKNPRSEFLLDLRQRDALLRWSGGELSVIADVTVDDRAQISIVVPSTAMSPQLFAFCKFFNPIEGANGECSMELESPLGQSARSEHVWLVSSDMASGRLILGCSELWVTTPAKGPENTLAYEYWIRGLRCHGSVTADFDFGQVRINGSMQIDDDLCGKIVVAPSVGLSEEEVDAGVDRVLAILSFATGRRLQAAVRQRHVVDAVESRIWPHDDLPPPMWAPFHFLDLAPIITSAARTCTKELCTRTGLDVAIQWMRAYSAHEAVRFVQLMIATEHLIECAKARAARLPGDTFEELKGRLENALNEFIQSSAGESHGAERQELLEAIGRLNQPVAKKGIEKLLKSYRVPYEDLAEYIGPIVNLRNKLVHKGVDPPRTGEDVLEFELLLRELLTRTFLAILEFEGTYRSWVGGPSDVTFCRTPEPTLS